MHAHTPRRSTAAGVVLAVLAPIALVELAQVLGAGSLAGAVVGHSIRQRVEARATGPSTKVTTIVIGKTRTNRRRKDTDRDGLKDKVDKTGRADKRFGRAKSDPSTCDTDRGGVGDGREVRARSNPSDVRSGPRHPMARNGCSDRLPPTIG